ncbi:MAG: hypothetical protein J6Z38_00510, partial [Lachnospiraceae bacterium]|nr:hypothetical protein [Lachnospiraceae bacterium]
PEEADRLRVLSTGLYDRNRSEEYNAGRRKAYQHERKQSFPGGLVVALWDVSDGRISSVKIEGDFFGELDVSGLEVALSGAEATEEGVRSRLMTTDLSRYVSGASPEDFAALFTDAEM